MAERLRQAIESIVVDYEGEEITFTISLGVAEINSHQLGYHEWLEFADQALYEAKNNGRNQSVISAK